MSDWNGNTATAERDEVSTSSGDTEVDALATVTSVLGKLDEAARARVMAFANDRFGTAPAPQAKRGK